MQFLIPIRSLQNGKKRLAPMMDPHTRAALIQAMLLDCLDAVSAVAPGDQITVVSRDAETAEIAQAYRLRHVADDAAGLNEAVARGLAELRDGPVVILMPDLPFLNAFVLKDWMERLPAPSAGQRNLWMGLAPSAHQTGTNALYLSRLQHIRTCFGDNSLRRHLELAGREQFTAEVVLSQGIGFDLDTPQDVIRMYDRYRNGCPLGSHTKQIVVPLFHQPLDALLRTC